MDDGKSNIKYYHGDGEEFHDAPDDFPFYDCEESFPERIESNGGVSSFVSDTKLVSEDEPIILAALRRRRSLSHRNSSNEDSIEMSKPSSSVCADNNLNSRKRKVSRSRKVKEYEKKLENENSDTVELKHSSETVADIVSANNNEKKEECSSLTDAHLNDIREDSIPDELNSRENHETSSSLLLTLAGIMIKAIIFQIDSLVKFLTFPVSLTYYLFMLVFNPLGLLKCCRGYILKILKRILTLVCENLSQSVYEWFKENKAIWKLGLKCGWGLLWSTYVCTVLLGLLVSAFVMGGLLIRGMVEEPMRMKSSLNFDYTEKSPVALVSIIAYPGMSYDIHLGEKLETGKASGLRVIPPNHKLQVTVSLTLPESDYNQNLGIFQVRVDFLANEGKTLASSRRPCMLQFKSRPIRLLLTVFKVAPILTGYTSEIQNLKVCFKGFKEGVVPTASLRVVIEQRAEFRPGAGIPEIYDASLILESELPFLRKFIWFWKKTLFVWISMMIFTMELVFALVCCKPFVIPRIRLGEGGNGDASQNDSYG